MMAARPPEAPLRSRAIAQLLIWSGHNCGNFAGIDWPIRDVACQSLETRMAGQAKCHTASVENPHKLEVAPELIV
jgi:hypothetical protein